MSDLLGGNTEMRLQVVGELVALYVIQRWFAAAGLVPSQRRQTQTPFR